MTRYSQIGLTILVSLLLTSCGISPGPKKTQNSGGLCLRIFSYGLLLSVSANQWKSGSTPNGLVITITDGRYSETYQWTDSKASQLQPTLWAIDGGSGMIYFDSSTGIVSISAAGERKGTYQISAQHPTLGAKSLSNVTVTGDECHVEATPVSLSY